MHRRLQLFLLAIFLLGLSPAAEDKKLAVYSPQTNFSVSVIDHDGQEYVSVTDLVDPFGNATLTHKGDRWKLKLSPASGAATEAEFTDGSDSAKIKGKKIQLTHAFWSDGQRGYIPVGSAPVLMLQFTHQSANLRENSRRLFIGDVSTTYTTDFQKTAPNKLVLHFSAPVNPSVSTEPGHVRLTFNRDPLISSGTNPQPLDSPTIKSATFAENNGSAELTIATTAPALATFSDGGRTITLTATPPPAQTAQTPATTAAPTPTTPESPTQQTTTSQPPAAPRFFVILDPAHGGDDPGATLGDGLFEKDVTLALARRIRADLEQRGITAVLLREGDATLTLDQRAIAANASRGSIYLSVHASSFGTGVRLYTARFAGIPKLPAHAFLPWNTAQATFLDQSHNLEASLVTELDSHQIHSVPLESGLRPLRNIAKAAIAIEVAEPATVPEAVKEGLSSIPYQQSVAAAIGAGIANLRGSMEGGK